MTAGWAAIRETVMGLRKRISLPLRLLINRSVSCQVLQWGFSYLDDNDFLQSCERDVCWKRISDTRFGYIRQYEVYLLVVSH